MLWLNQKILFNKEVGKMSEKLIIKVALQSEPFECDRELLYGTKGGATPSNYFCNQISERVISVIRQNVHLVAESCSRCHGKGLSTIRDTRTLKFDDCPACKGHGVIAKQERV